MNRVVTQGITIVRVPEAHWRGPTFFNNSTTFFFLVIYGSGDILKSQLITQVYIGIFFLIDLCVGYHMFR